MPCISNVGVRISYEVYGAGTPLVFLHAGSLNSTAWFYQAMSFAATHRVVLIDHRGHGRSDKPKQGYSITQHADDTGKVLQALGIEQAVFVGNSLGGMVALQFNLDYPERVLGNVVISSATGLGRNLTGADREAFLADFTTSFSVLMDGSVSARTRREQPELLPALKAFSRVPDNYPEVAFAAAFSDPGGPFNWDIHPRLQEITAPALIFAGSDDAVIPAAESARLADAMPNATFRLIPDVAHFYQLERPQLFNAELREFLSGITG